ncbi:uncharacterized protein LOC111306410 [Durio zibethinus]|uniref:Uncharacterized protein LOC111306410 n=1 Tax=Durio zibethinus TaxID=66656 RepID=A0A6P6A5L9_DURZI|nr:uncharacterized protein LOC111306410 [Durio zibethinus]
MSTKGFLVLLLPEPLTWLWLRIGLEGENNGISRVERVNTLTRSLSSRIESLCYWLKPRTRQNNNTKEEIFKPTPRKNMEQHKRSCRQGTKKVLLGMSNKSGGSGIEGVVVWGGALAIASLVAFTIKKGSRKDGNKDTTNLAAIDSCRKEEHETEGLSFILQEDSSSTLHQNSCCTNHGTSEIGITQIEACELVSIQSLITSVTRPHSIAAFATFFFNFYIKS